MKPDVPAYPILARMQRLGVRLEDLEERFSRASGPGGQHVNKVSTAVTLTHHPSGVSVTVQDSRLQSWNRRLARERLLDALEAARKQARAAARAAREKERRQNAPRPRAVKRRILENKRKRGETKQGRKRIE